jgi:hypothetical protein
VRLVDATIIIADSFRFVNSKFRIFFFSFVFLPKNLLRPQIKYSYYLLFYSNMANKISLSA